MCLHSFAAVALISSGGCAHLLAMQVFVWMNGVDARAEIFNGARQNK
jgi:hypothetical protein